MMGSRVGRWAFHQPWLVFGTLTAGGAVATALDRWLVGVAQEYRDVVWIHDTAVEWPAMTSSHAITLEILSALSSLCQGVLFVVLPLAALFRVLGTRSQAENTTTASSGRNDDTLVAATALQLIHHDLENPLTWVVGDLDERAMIAHGIRSVMGHVTDEQGITREDRVYRRSDICSYLDVLRVRVADKLELVRRFGPIVASRRGHEMAWPRTRSPFLDVLDRVMGRGAERIPDSGTSERWRWVAAVDGNAVVDVRVRPEIYSVRGPASAGMEVLADAPDSVIMIPLKEAVINAARAVARRRAADGLQPTSVTSIWVTVYVTYDVIWVYVNDDGPGLRGESHAELAELGKTEGGGGRGLGLYICEALSRLGSCRYFLDDHPDGGAVARIMFYRDRARGGHRG
jgi:hypothetical protein